MVSPERQSAKKIDILADEVFCCTARDIGINGSEFTIIKEGLDEDSLMRLIAIGWNDNEMKDLLTVIFNASEENRIGVFGSMSRGKAGSTPSMGGKPADKDSDIDTVVEASMSFPENVSITRHDGPFSGRPIDVFIYRGDGAKYILGEAYPCVIWVYENPRWVDAQFAAIYQYMYGF